MNRDRRLFTRFAQRLAPPHTIRSQALRVLAQGAALARAGQFHAAANFLRASWRLYRLTGSLIIEPPPPPPPYTYSMWLDDQRISQTELQAQRERAREFAFQPVFTLITPVFNPPAAVLQAAIDSVVAQSYPRWTLVLVNAAPDNAEIGELLANAATACPAVTVINLAQNQGISANTNAGLAAASGDYLLFLDHDDLLAPDALFAITAAIQHAPETEIIYFDEDKVTADGAERHSPWFKPAWSPHLMLSTNLLMHGVYRRTLVESVGRLDPATDGAQDWDLALRCMERTQAIVHVPQVLYHWRQLPGSAAASATAKPWALAAQLQAIRNHLQRTRTLPAAVDFAENGHVRVRFPAVAARVSIIIPTRDKVELVRACLDSLLERTRYPAYELLLVDTGSVEAATHAYYATLATEPRVRLLHYTESFNFSRVNNWAARAATGDLLLFLNNDIEIHDPDWLLDLAGWAVQPDIGAVGAQLVRPDGSLQHAGVVMGLAGHAANPGEGLPPDSYTIFGSTMWYRDYQAVTGACLMVQRAVFEAFGGFDEVYQIGYSDLELCLRIRQRGGSVLYTPFARLIHHEGGTRGLYLPHFDVMRASCQLTAGCVAGDPFYNPNLSRASRTPELARPDEPSTVATITTILQHYELLPGQADAASLAGALLSVPPPEPWPLPVRALPSSPRRLLLVTHDLSLSGAPILLCALARRLRRAGYAVRVLSAKDGPLHDDYRALGCEVIVRPDLLEQLENALLIAEAVAGCDGVIANTILAWRAIHTAAAYALPVAWWLHESHFGLSYAQAHAGAASAFAVANLVIFPSHFQAELFGALRRPANSRVLYYGLPDAPSIHGSDAAALPARRLRALHIGSLESRKGQDILLRAVALLPPAVAAVVEFALIGRVIEPEYAAAIEEQVRQLAGAQQGTEVMFDKETEFLANTLQTGAPTKKLGFSKSHSFSVELLGELPRQAVLAQLAEADIFLLTSRDEVLPVTLLEAMALGKAIAAAAVAGVPEAIEDGVSGLLFPTGDAATLARQIERLVADAGLRFSLGQHARQTAAGRFAEEENLAAMLAAIENSFGWEQRAAQ